jgi:phage FluMu protein Com
MSDLLLSQIIFTALVAFQLGRGNKDNYKIWLGIAAIIFIGVWIGSIIWAGILAIFGINILGETIWVTVWPHYVVWFALFCAWCVVAIGRCNKCKKIGSAPKVISEVCKSKTFDYADSKGNPIVKYKHVNKDGSPDKRYNDNIMMNTCKSSWQIKKKCPVCGDMNETTENRETIHTTTFELPKKYQS